MVNHKKILVVEDEVDLAHMMKLRLNNAGFEALFVHDGQEGFEKAKKENPDLIILDLMLPKMDGYKVCALLKKDIRYAKIPIIIFTAKAQDEDQKLGFECGADAFLTKPFEASTLLAKIQELLGK